MTQNNNLSKRVVLNMLDGLSNKTIVKVSLNDKLYGIVGVKKITSMNTLALKLNSLCDSISISFLRTFLLLSDDDYILIHNPKDCKNYFVGKAYLENNILVLSDLKQSDKNSPNL